MPPDIIDLVDGTLAILGQSGDDILVWLAPLSPPLASSRSPAPSVGSDA